MTQGTSKINMNIKGTDMDLTPSISEHIHKKVSGLEKFINPSGDQEVFAEVEVALRSRHHRKGDIYKADINLTCNGKKYHADSKKSDLFTAIDDMVDSIERSVRKSREKKTDLVRRGALRAKQLLRKLRRKD